MSKTKTLIFNKQILLFLFFFVLLLCFSVSFFKESDTELGTVLLIASLLVCVGIFTTPLYFVFTKNEITGKYIFGYKKVISWGSVKNIIEIKWGQAYKALPHYQLIYNYNYNGRMIIKQFDIPRNRKTKAVIEKYAKYKII